MGRSREGSHQEDPGLVGTFSDFRDWMWNLLASVCLAVIVAASVVAAAVFFFSGLIQNILNKPEAPNPC